MAAAFNWGLMLALAGLLVVLLAADSATACNENVCASVVSKCLLTQSCKCDLKNCTCCSECYSCLNHYFADCCDCIEMCPNKTDNSIEKRFYVEKFSEDFPVPGMFVALTEHPDPQGRWESYSFPNEIKRFFLNAADADANKKIIDNNLLEGNTIQSNNVVMANNCTVAYMSDCVSTLKCRQVCQSMGSNGFRWFNDGCCQCYGDTCLNFGSDQSRCSRCPLSEGDFDEDENMEEVDYGQYSDD